MFAKIHVAEEVVSTDCVCRVNRLVKLNRQVLTEYPASSRHRERVASDGDQGQTHLWPSNSSSSCREVKTSMYMTVMYNPKSCELYNKI